MAQTDKPIDQKLAESVRRMRLAQETAKANSPRRESIERRLEDAAQPQPGRT